MKIIQRSSGIQYSKNKVVYLRDATRQEHDLSEIKVGKYTRTAYFIRDYKNNRITDALVRVGNKIARFFGAKTISENNLSNCLRKASAYFNIENESKYKFTINQLFEAKVTLQEIKDSKKFGKYLLELNRGRNDINRLEFLSYNIDRQLERRLVNEFAELIKKLKTDLAARFPRKSTFGADETTPIYLEYVNNMSARDKKDCLVKVKFLYDLCENETYKIEDTSRIHGFVGNMKRILECSIEENSAAKKIQDSFKIHVKPKRIEV